MTTRNVEALLKIIQDVVIDHPYFFRTSGAGQANKESIAFVKMVQERAKEKFGQECVERKINASSRMAVDYYFEEEKTIVEVARLIKNSNSEFHKDILKAIMAKDYFPVDCLVFIGGPGSEKACVRPAYKAIIDWVYDKHNLHVEVYDIKNVPIVIPPDSVEVED